MKAKRRVVTSPPGSAATRASRGPRKVRTPTVRRITSAIVPVQRPAGGVDPTRAGGPPGALGGRANSFGSGPRGEQPSADVGPFEPGAADVDLSVDLASPSGGVRLENPVLVAAGVFGYGIESADAVDVERLGGIVTRGTTLKPRSGQQPPRTAETPAGLLNGVGLQNPGIEVVIERYAPIWRGWRVPVIVNLGADSVADFVELARRLDGLPGIAGIELNLSCPNAARGGTLFALDPDAAAALTSAVRRATDMPLLVKLSASAADVRAVARSVAAAGADALTAINTLPGLALAPDRRGPLLGSGYGGLSGPAITPIGLRVVYEVAQVVDIPILAVGGIVDLDGVLDYLAAGATAVQVGTAVFADPGLPVRLAAALADECARRGLGSYRPLIGTALPVRGAAGSRASQPSSRGVEYRP